MASGSEARSIHLEEPRIEDRKTLLVAGLMKEYRAETANEIPLLWQQLSRHFGEFPRRLIARHTGFSTTRRMPTALPIWRELKC